MRTCLNENRKTEMHEPYANVFQNTTDFWERNGGQWCQFVKVSYLPYPAGRGPVKQKEVAKCRVMVKI
jgi:hypothetical protein